MKQIGDILKSRRDELGLSIADLSSRTKIDPDYVLALEKGDYSKLPSETFTKGFIRNLSSELGLDPAESLAIFRRDYLPNLSKPVTKTTPRVIGSRTFVPRRYIAPVVSLLVFIAYLLYQFRAVVRLPELEIVSPRNNSVVTNPIFVEGKTDSDAYVTINQETRLRPDTNGRFSGRISLPLGENDLTIQSISRFDRTTTLKYKITVVSP